MQDGNWVFKLWAADSGQGLEYSNNFPSAEETSFYIVIKIKLFMAAG